MMRQRTTTTSTAEDLWNLTEHVMKMQEIQHDNDPNNGSNILLDEGFGSSADELANNATRLLQRHRAGKSTTNLVNETQSTSTPPVTMTSAASRWKKVKTVVTVAGITSSTAAASKKNDEVTENIESSNEGSGVSNKLDLLEQGMVSTNSESGSSRRRKKHGLMQSAAVQVKSGFQEFEDWVMFKKTNICTYVKMLLYLILPATGIASMYVRFVHSNIFHHLTLSHLPFLALYLNRLFYWADNPPCGTYDECLAKKAIEFNNSILNITADNGNLFNNFWENSKEASYSWWILFIFVRHVLMVTLAALSQEIVVDYLCMRTQIALKTVGPMVTLYTVQSKGLPFIMTFWGMFSFMFLYGKTRFANNWLFWQDVIDMFNASNPSGGVTGLNAYKTVLILSIAVGVSVSFKRFWVGLFLGRQTFHRYAADLAVLMRKVLLLGQVATLSKEIELYGYKLSDFNFHHESYQRTIRMEEDRITECPSGGEFTNPESGAENGLERVFGLQKDFSGSSTRIKIEKLLGAWEEPKEFRKSDVSLNLLAEKVNDFNISYPVHFLQEKINISSIIQFRSSLACLNTHVPFSSAFGLASTRQECIESSENLFRRLLKATPGEHLLSFDVIASVAVSDSGHLDESKVKELIKIFRPDREGNLSLIDCAKSVDAVYKYVYLIE
jgi:hypothetical protein